MWEAQWVTEVHSDSEESFVIWESNERARAEVLGGREVRLSFSVKIKAVTKAEIVNRRPKLRGKKEEGDTGVDILRW